MRTLTTLALLALLVGCDLPTGNLEYLNDYAGEVVEYSQVAEVQCESLTLDSTINEESDCQAFTATGTQVETSGSQPVMWDSTADSVALVNFDGLVTAISPGTTDIVASGPAGSSASVTVTVQ